MAAVEGGKSVRTPVPASYIIHFSIILEALNYVKFHNFMTSTISEPTEKKIAPISPDFNTQAIESIKKKEIIEPLYEAGSPSVTPPLTENINNAGVGQATPSSENLPEVNQ